MSWVLKKGLGIDLEKIWSWLGFVFDWKAILRMQALLVRLAGKTFEHGRTKIHGAEETVSAFFLDLKSKAKKLASVKMVQRFMAQTWTNQEIRKLEK